MKRRFPGKGQALLGLLFILPPLLILTLLVLWPAADAVRFALGLVPEGNVSYSSGLDLVSSKVPTLQVFRNLFASESFARDLRLTLWVTLVSVALVAALLDVRKDGQPFIAGKQVTGFSVLEERLAWRKDKVPFLLEDELKQRGAHYGKSFLPFTPHVVTDGRLVTGQNPQSAKAVAERVIELLP